MIVRFFNVSFAAALIFAMLLVAVLVPTPSAAAQWNAGVASVVITPEEPTWLCGYSSRDKPAEGKVHDLYAKALAIEDDQGTRLVMVTMDLGSVSEKITSTVAERVLKRYELPRKSLLLNVSHTHCAPEVAAEREVFHALPPDEEAKLASYIAWLEDQLVALIGAALEDLSPASLYVGKSSASFAYSRRFPTDGGFVNRQNPDGLVDRDVPVLQVRDTDGNLRAVLFGYACHNTTLAFYQYCGDYAGFAQEFLEADHPGVTALFMMGCGGDQNPYPRQGPSGLEYCREHGRELADAVDRALAGERTEVHGPLRVAYGVTKLDLEPAPTRDDLESDARTKSGHPQRKARYLLSVLDRGEVIPSTQTCPIHVARFGDDLLFVAISGETVVEYSVLCKRQFAGPFVWVAGYTDDVFAYLPTLRVLREGGYEGRDGIVHQLVPTPFAPSVEQRVMELVDRLVDEVSQP